MPDGFPLERFDAAAGSAGADGLPDALAGDAPPDTGAPDDGPADAPETGAVDADLEDAVQALSGLLEALPGRIEHRFAESARASGAACADAVSALLPALVGRHGADEIAAAVTRLIRAAPPRDIALHVSADDHARVLPLLERAAPARPVTVTADPGMAAGTARLTWQDGGGVIDLPALLDQVSAMVAARCASLEKGTAEHDE